MKTHKRDYKKESEWQKERYTLIKAYVDKQLGEKLKSKLKSENKTIAKFIKENAENYLKMK